MTHINKRRPNTRLQIIQLAAHMFIGEGYEKTTYGKMSKLLDLSPGNITFYFPTKEHLLVVLVDELFDFQNLTMEHAAEEGKSSLLSYCLELTSIAAVCEDDEIAREFYSAAYKSKMILELVRKNDTEKTKHVFAKYCPDFTDEDWIATENIVSGIEYATIMTTEKETPLAVQISRALDAIMLLYNVPKDVRQTQINKVLSINYRELGRNVLNDFRKYIDIVNEENLKNNER